MFYEEKIKQEKAIKNKEGSYCGDEDACEFKNSVVRKGLSK